MPGTRLHGMRLKELHGMRLKELHGTRLRLRLHGTRLRLRLRLKEHIELGRTLRRLMQHAEPRLTLTLLQRLRQGVQGVLLVRTQPRLLRRLPGMRRRRLKRLLD
jgi:hypothetical protein